MIFRYKLNSADGLKEGVIEAENQDEALIELDNQFSSRWNEVIDGEVIAREALITNVVIKAMDSEV